MKIDQERILRNSERASWQVPFLVAVLATPFIIVAINTENYHLEIMAKLVWLFFTIVLFGYNLLIRSLRKRFRENKGL